MEKPKTYRVEVVEIKTGNVVAVVGKGLDERGAERRINSVLGQTNTEEYFVRDVEENEQA